MKRGPQEEAIPYYGTDWVEVARLLKGGANICSPAAFERRKLQELKRRLEQPLPIVGGYVYVFAAGDHVKIGLSWFDVERRWNTIRSSNPLLERPLYVSHELGERASKVEKSAHTALATYHFSGEWFSCDRALAVETVKNLVEEVAS